MSKVAITGNASGTGTLTLSAPNTDTDRTLTLPDNTGTIITTGSTFAGTGPAFNAYGTALQSIASATYTKVNFNTEYFDTNSNYDTVNNRFTPSVSGYYQVNATVSFASSSAGRGIINIYINGSTGRLTSFGLYNGSPSNFQNSSLIYLNGTTDYIECYMYQDSGISLNCGSGSLVVTFSAALVRAA
jgi:hypothetical protein